ncbi:hypothetical protein XENTR_v10023809, partial [Xenopus tropicalis]
MNFSRYPVEATGVGMVQNGKIKTYMLSILWSDRNNILIYRTYEEFKDLAKQLKRKFPLESGLLNKSERIIPILKDIPLIYRSTRFSNRFIERLHLAELYSQELLQTDSKISQCEDVIQFFSPNNQDLAPTFTENSLVIMPSDKDQKKVNHQMKSSAPVSEPVITQKYICIETFETKDTKNRPFKVNKDELVDVLIKDPTGWWLVENEDGNLAWFPGPYLVEPADAACTYSNRKSLNDGTSYYAVKGYQAQNSDELSLGVGVVVEVIEKSDNGWWQVCYNEQCGYVPSMFLKPYCNPHQQLQVTFTHHRFGSTPNLHKAPSCLTGIHEPNTADKEYRTENGNNEASLNIRRSRSVGEFKDFQEFQGNVLGRRSSTERFIEWEAPHHDDYPLPTAESNNSEKIRIIISSEDNEDPRPNQSQTDSTQSHLRKDSKLDHSTQSRLRKDSELDHSTQSRLRKDSELDHSTQSRLRKDSELDHSTQSRLRKDSELDQSTT